MSKLKEIQDQIKELQRQEAEEINRQKDSVITDIKEKIKLYKISAEDLGYLDPASLINTKSANKKPVKPKYQSPDGKDTWSGRGPRPKWFKELLEQGHSKENLLIKAQ